MESILIKSTNDQLNYPLAKDYPSIVQTLKFASVTRCSDNVLTIDSACYKYDNNEYSDTINIVKLQDEVFRDKGKQLFVKYVFIIKNLIRNLRVSIEDRDVDSVLVNGVQAQKLNSYYIDKSIRSYDISKLQKIGQNEIVLTFNHTNYSLPNIENVFETERNRFFYPITIESIYVAGDFSLDLIEGKISNNINNFSIENPRFEIVNSKSINPEIEISQQGLFFYRGPIKYSAEFESLGEETYLAIPEYKGPLIKLFINNKFVCIVLDSSYIEISRYIIKGINKVEVELICSNRNTLGPHHHYLGETTMTGIHTFKGEEGFEDEFDSFLKSSSTWTDNYSFVPNGLNKFLIKKVNKGQNL